MHTLHPQFITDAAGKKISVVLPLREYEAILEALDDVEDVVLFDESKNDASALIPASEVFKEIEANRTQE